LTKTPYDFRRITPDVYGDRRPVSGEVVALLHIYFEDRGLKLIEARSRAMQRGEIHELMITDEQGAAPDGGVNRVRAVAFFEVEAGGLAVVGDEVTISGRPLGTLAGYDLTHMPNHMNVLVKTQSVDEPEMRVGDRVLIRRP
jgi:hypothetical protein